MDFFLANARDFYTAEKFIALKVQNEINASGRQVVMEVWATLQQSYKGIVGDLIDYN